MANRRFDKDWCIGPRIIRVMGSFGTNTAAAPVASSVKGFGFGYAPVAGVMTLFGNVASKNFLTTTPGITYTATGIYTITFEDLYLDLISFDCNIQQTAGNSTFDANPADVANLGSSTAAPTIKIQVTNTTTGNQATPPAAGAQSRINFEAVFRDSTEQFGKP